MATGPAPALLTGVGLALAAGALAAMLVSQVIVQDRAVADAVGRLPPDQRVVSVSWVGSGTSGRESLDRQARRALNSLRIGPPVKAVVFRSTRFGTEVVRLAAIDDLGGQLELRSGRLPARCGRRACELLALDGPQAPLLSTAFSVVGSATARPDLPRETLIGSQAAGERVFVANGIDALADRPELSGLFRTLTWAVPLDPAGFDSEKAAGFTRRITGIDTALRRRSDGFAVRAPLDELAAAAERGERASRRQLLVVGQCVALFLAFAVLAASRLRRSAREARYRLRRLRAQRWQSGLETLGSAVVIAVPAVLLGWIAGASIGAALAAAADRPLADALRRSVLASQGFLILLGLVLVAVVVLVLTVRARTLEIRGLRVTAADVAAVGALAVVATAVAFTDSDAASLSEGSGSGRVLLLLPILVALAGALVTARVLGPALRLGERVAPAAGVSVRLALLSLVRSPGPAGVAAACLAVTTAMAVYAVSYRATLAANQRDTAAYAAPLDYVVARDATSGRSFGAPTELAPWYARRRPVAVIRREGEAPTLNRSERLTMIGIPAVGLPTLRWRDDYSDRSLEDLARAIAYPGGGLEGVEIPVGAEELILPRSVRGDPIRISANVRRPDGGFSVLDLLGPSRSTAVRAKLGRRVGGGTLVALTLGFPAAAEFTSAHRATGSRPAPDVFLRGRLIVGRPRVRSRDGVRSLPVDYRSWVRSDGSGGGGSRTSRLELRYVLTQERTFRIRPRQPTDGQPIPVIASSSIATAAGDARILPIRLAGAEIEVRIAATAQRFPTLSGDFLIADRSALETAANAAVPGAAVADEAWFHGDPGAEPVLRRAAPVPVRIVSRSALEARLRADPVSRAASIGLLAATALALVLALAGVLVALAADARDERADLFDLEALGLEPARLARHLWIRSAFVLGAGLIGGLLAGAAISFVVTDVVEVTANATAAEPPLVAVLDWPILVAGLGLFALTALGALALAARAQFRAPAPERPEVA